MPHPAQVGQPARAVADVGDQRSARRDPPAEQPVIGRNRVVIAAGEQTDRCVGREVRQIVMAGGEGRDHRFGHAIGDKEGAGAGRIGKARAGILQAEMAGLGRFDVDQVKRAAEA
ncbi:hypothetical protein JMJ92_12760, partial [Rhodovulum visakhapatnamense]|nr:hypothetical protein [Rhodovulum visakhapatnamense]